MNLRSRLYVFVAAARHLLIAIPLMVDPERYRESPSFGLLFVWLSPRTWAVMLLATAAVAAYGAGFARARVSRVACVASVALCWAWAAAFVLVAFHDPKASWILAVTFSALAAKDMLIAGAPYVDASILDAFCPGEVEQPGRA